MPTFENIIIGAGPYGLSVAAHLRGANVSHAIFGVPMQSWRRHMPAGMALKSEPFASNLADPTRSYTLERFSALRGKTYASKGVPLSISDFIDYADWFQREAAPDVCDAKLIRLRRIGGAFELTFDDRQIVAKRVIVATGHLAFRQFPESVRRHLHDAPALVSHTADHHDLAGFAGEDVTIVGSGQSGLETAALLHEQGANVRVLARGPVIGWNAELDSVNSPIARLRHPESGIGPGWRSLFYSELPRVFHLLPARLRRRIVATANGPAGAWWLKNRVIDRIPLLTSHQIIAAERRGSALHLSVRNDRATVQIATDHVIAATGYRVDLGRLPFLDPALLTAIRTLEGAPMLNAVFESSVPGLHFVGIASAPSFGPVMRFVYGARHAAAILTSHIHSSARQRSALSSVPLGVRTAVR